MDDERIKISVQGPKSKSLETSTTYLRIANALKRIGIDVVFHSSIHDHQVKELENLTDEYIDKHGRNPERVEMSLN